MFAYIIPVSSKTSPLIWALTGSGTAPESYGMHYVYPIDPAKPPLFLDDAQLLAFEAWAETMEDCSIRLATF
jgi:hypothetical protein